MISFQDPITVLPGIGAKRAKLFEKLNIRSIYDLITHYPRTYEDRRTLVDIADLREDFPSCFEAMVCSQPYSRLIRKGLEITQVTVADSSGRLKLTFFNQKYRAEQLTYGESYSFFGALSPEGYGLSMLNPSFEPIGESGVTTRCILPVYPLTAGISPALLKNSIQNALKQCLSELPELLPPEVIRDFGLCSGKEAFRLIHAPSSFEDIASAKRRLIFEEYFVFSCCLGLSRQRREEYRREPFLNLNMDDFYALLPYSLTEAQKRAIGDILLDFSGGVPMNRLLQGDVGSGKTVVAAAAIVAAARNGCQSAIMAPTEILAEQHFKFLSPLLQKLGFSCGILTGSSSSAERKRVLSDLQEGRLDCIVGTHALFSESVQYERLGLVIADEQHRFGVAQRDALQQKGDHPHLLVMSATPIPRTLALIAYGDLNLSVLDEKPAGRKAILTYLVSESMRARINAFIRKQVKEGHQVYIVCPAVEEDEENNLKSVESWAETLQQTVFPDMKVLLLHGQMKGEEKEKIMADFSAGKGDILVATTVIEVGVDVKGATLMVVENAERFGLSQLHQLRGRVGRNDAQSYCVLFSNSKNPETLERLKTLCKSEDGFAIAESDLSMRGPGDFFGSRQSGLPVFRTADLSSDLEILTQAKEAADRYLLNPFPYEGRDLLRFRVGDLYSHSGDNLN